MDWYHFRLEYWLNLYYIVWKTLKTFLKKLQKDTQNLPRKISIKFKTKLHTKLTNKWLVFLKLNKIINKKNDIILI